MKRLAIGLIVATFAGCGGGSGDSATALTTPAWDVDLTSLAAVIQMWRATLVVGIGSGIAERAVPSEAGVTQNCDVSGTFRRSVDGAGSRVAIDGCSMSQGPSLRLSGMMPTSTTLSAGFGMAGTGLLLGVMEGMTVAESGSVSASLTRGSGEITANLGTLVARFDSGAVYRVNSAIAAGTTVLRGNDVAFTGRFSTRFEYKGRDHIVSSTAPLSWEPGVGVVGGAMMASFSDVTGIRNYEIRYEASGVITMTGLASAPSASFTWGSADFQAALRAVLTP